MKNPSEAMVDTLINQTCLAMEADRTGPGKESLPAMFYVQASRSANAFGTMCGDGSFGFDSRVLPVLSTADGGDATVPYFKVFSIVQTDCGDLLIYSFDDRNSDHLTGPRI